MTARQVVIALGTNVGDRGRNAWWAIQELMRHDIKVLRCSGLYETAAAYVQDQPSFLNAAVLAQTSLPPRQLLATLKSIESAAGRDTEKGPRWGPRPLDLDIVFLSEQPYQDDLLTVPHPRWQERDFVLQPVGDLWYSEHDNRPSTSAGPPPLTRLDSQLKPMVQRAYQWALRQAHSKHAVGPPPAQAAVPESHSQPASSSAGPGGNCGGPGSGSGVGQVMRRVTPIGRGGRVVSWGERTLVMGILNVTPDSFSDGGQFMTSTASPSHPTTPTLPQPSDTPSQGAGAGELSVDVAAVVATGRQMVQDGADILDVGGQSTRPGAVRLTSQQELSRVIPVIRHLRSCPEFDSVIVSVDTFDTSVAKEAVHAGADLVNDVSGGSLDPLLRHTVAELGVPYVLMHMRGDPTTMQRAPHTHYHDLVADVGRELQHAADLAVAAGIPAWNIITDPGIGFAKTSEGNLELMRGLRHPLRDRVLQGAFRGGPMLVGPSRKGFLGKLTGRSAAKDRDAATVAAVVACVEQGADIVRVHNVRATVDALKVADALYRHEG